MIITNPLIIVTFSIIIFLLSLCNADDKSINPQFYGDTFDWKNSGLLEFIEILKNKQSEVCPTYSIYGFHDKWVKEYFTAYCNYRFSRTVRKCLQRLFIFS